MYCCTCLMGLYIYYSALCASFSGFLFGYESGSINGVKDMLGYRQALNLSYLSVSEGDNSSESCNFEDDVETSAILGLMVSLAAAGGVLGALGGGWFSDRVGRKPAIILGGSLVALSGVMHASAVRLWMVLLSRIPAGMGIGMVYLVAPIYIGEISKENVRGRFLSVFTVWTTTGFAVAIVVNILVGQVLYGWRISVGMQTLTGTLLALGMGVAPRSPRWLLLHGKEKKALDVLKYIYQTQDKAESYYNKIKCSSNVMSFREQVKLTLQWKVLQRLLLGVILFILGRLTGGNFLAYFSVSIFCKIGLPGFIVSLAIAGAVFLAMVLSMAVVDKLGRKPLFLTGLGVMVAAFGASAALIIIFDLEETSSEEVNKVAAYFTLVFICFNLAGFIATCGSIPWIIMGELFPLPVKGLVTSVCNSTFWLGVIVSNQLAPIIISTPLRVSGLLLLFLAATVINYLFVLFFLPETKGLTLENIERLYSTPWRERVQVLYYVKCLCYWDLLRGTVKKEVVVLPDQEESQEPLVNLEEQSYLEGEFAELDERVENQESSTL